MAILAAALHRQQTGEGQFLDVSMLDSALAWNTLAIADTLAGVPPAPESGLLNGGSAYDTYATADGRYLAVGALEPKFWRAFCAVIERTDLANAPPALAQEGQPVVKEAVAAAIAAQPLAYWVERFVAVDACVEPVLAPGESVEHPQAVARGALVPVPNPAGEPQSQVAHPARFSATPPAYRYVGPPLGAHTRAILVEAGFSPSEVADLQAQGVVHLAGEDDAG
jgi:crotonobetainyl-CoA:carnitine CoA-transferase CaiB-like acyl-CoA transferase